MEPADAVPAELQEPGSQKRRGPLLVGLVVVALAAAGVVAFATRGSPSPLSQARDLVADNANFVTATDTGVTFIRVSRLVRDEAERCADDEGLRDDRCEALFAASAYAQINAVQVLECTRPGVFTAREAMQGYLAQLDEGRLPDPPPPTRC